MDYLPKDPAILVSSINMLLRDEEFDSLDSLCYAFSRDPKEIKDYLFGKGFVWSEQQKRKVYIHSSLEWQKDNIEYAIMEQFEDKLHEDLRQSFLA